MKIDLGDSNAEKDTRLSKWHKFFPFFPRKVGSHDWRMFEYVERRMTGQELNDSGLVISYEYRLPEQSDA